MMTWLLWMTSRTPLSSPRILGPLGVILILLPGMGCAVTPAKDPVSLQNARSLKVESLALMDKATDPPTAHAAEIQSLRQKLQQALEHERQRGDRNAVSVQQWQLLQDPKGNLLGGFLHKWETEGVGRSPAFLAGAKQLVGDAFDEIIKVQSQ